MGMDYTSQKWLDKIKDTERVPLADVPVHTELDLRVRGEVRVVRSKDTRELFLRKARP